MSIVESTTGSGGTSEIQEGEKEKVKLENQQGKDPQLVLTFASVDGNPFNAKLSVDLIVRNAHDHVKTGHAHTLDYVRTERIVIPVNFPDSISEWNYGVKLEGARLGFGVNVTLEYEDGRVEQQWITDHFTPTNDPPMNSDLVTNHHGHDIMPEDDDMILPIPIGTALLKGEKYIGPNGVYYLCFQQDGNLCVNLVDGDHFHWGTHNYIGVPLGGSHALVHDDGNLHIYDVHNELMWSTDAVGGAKVSIDENGTPIVLGHADELIWMG